MIDQGSSEISIIVGINEKDFEKKLARTENALAYLSENMYALEGILHAEKDAPITFEFTGTIES